MTDDTFTFSSDMAPTAPVGPLPAGRTLSGIVPLVRRDILAFEKFIRDDLAAVLPFEAHALYFPLENEALEPVWIPEESKLLLPLRNGDIFLGVLLLRKPDPVAAQALLPHLSAIVKLCLDKLALFKWGRSDFLTGLATKDVLLERMSRKMGQIRLGFASGPDMEESLKQDVELAALEADPSSDFHGTLGIIVFRLAHMRRVTRSQGHAVADKLVRIIGETLEHLLPEQALAARTGDEEFAVLIPGMATQSLEHLTRSCIARLNNVRLTGETPGTSVKADVYAGYALFPQDWDTLHEGRGGRNLRSEAESLFAKARLAAFRAEDMGKSSEGVMGYGAILPRGGVIEKILPLARVQTNLGRDVGAQEGQIFTVWSLNYPVQTLSSTSPVEVLEPLYKGEIVLADVREDSSQADVLLLGDPAWELEPGDHLHLVVEDRGTGVTETERSSKPDSLTGLFRHGEFLAKLAEARDKFEKFGMVLIRVQLPFPGKPEGMRDTEHGMGEASAILRELLDHRADYIDISPENNDDEKEGKAPYLLAGRYSLNSILVFHPHLDESSAGQIYEPIARELAERLRTPVAIGIACLPWLTYRAADAIECCRKALEYAILLPEPHVGVFDSLAINISADKRYSQGDVFGAIAEYRMALLADESNALAWNSLGVCLAGVGKHGEARRAFDQAVRRNLRDAAMHYNLGTACINTGELEEATKQFNICLELEPGYTFADIKLGELAEREGDYGKARSHFELAQKSDPSSPVPYRCLARLDIKAGKPEKAREFLHHALHRNPQDTFSQYLLARLYLDAGEDPEMAEELARQSVSLRPDCKAAWLELARALEAQGRHREARAARLGREGTQKAI